MNPLVHLLPTTYSVVRLPLISVSAHIHMYFVCTSFVLQVPETGLVGLFLPHKKRWIYMDVLASAFFVNFTVFLKLADPL